jgi:hypothetical protein
MRRYVPTGIIYRSLYTQQMDFQEEDKQDVKDVKDSVRHLTTARKHPQSDDLLHARLPEG